MPYVAPWPSYVVVAFAFSHAVIEVLIEEVRDIFVIGDVAVMPLINQMTPRSKR